MHEAATAATQVNFLWLIPAFPALGVLFNAFIGNRTGKRPVSLVAPGVVGAAFITGCYAFAQVLSLPPGGALVQRLWPWIWAGTLHVDVAFRIDALSAVMVLIVSGVGFLIHVYSVGYMAEDASYARYFTYLNLFTLAMLTLVMADNLPLLFVGWEGVGLCSYLLIGFWFTVEANAIAGKKAFVVNRIGDAGFLLGIFLIFWNLGAGVHSLSFTRDRGTRESNPAEHVDGHHVAALRRRHREIGAAAVVRLAAGRDGGPDPGQRADPCGHHGHRGRLHDRALARRCSCSRRYRWWWWPRWAC